MKQVWNCSLCAFFVGVFSSEYMPIAVFVEDVNRLFDSFNSVKCEHLARHFIAHLVTTVPILFTGPRQVWG
jgi:hypothetical protein